jgi:Lon protease-like protein
MADEAQTPRKPLPASLPLFPLPGVLLLPRGMLPLNIFEPRYINMFDDALGGARLIGMIQPCEATPRGANPPLYKTGCAGRITRFAEDGPRYLITLVGVCRFDVAEEAVTARGYRQAVPDWTPYAADLVATPESGIDRPRLLAGLKPFLRARGLSIDWSALDGASDEQLVTTMAMVCPFDAAEKQNLLQAPGLLERARLLTGLAEIALLDQPGSIARH